MANQKGRLFLIPTTLGSESTDTIPLESQRKINSLNHFVVERLRTARRFIRLISKEKNIDAIELIELDKRGDNNDEVKSAIEWLNNGIDIGLMSEAGAPCVADPGHLLVSAAHESNIEVVPQVGPSSIFLALMASGMNGQQFTFKGYLPVKKEELTKALSKMEALAAKTGHTQLFMETPYRNDGLWQTALACLKSSTRLGYASDLTLPSQEIRVKTVGEWTKGNAPNLHKRPTIFMMQSR